MKQGLLVLLLGLAFVLGCRLLLYVWMPDRSSDFDLLYQAAVRLVAGENPYPPAPQGLPYPLPADAIIVTRDPATRSTGFAYVPPDKQKTGQLVSATSRTGETPRIQVTAIAWKDGRATASSCGPHRRAVILTGIL